MIGHTSMVTALEMLQKSPVLVTADDSGTVKLWDVRTFKCIQTFTLGTKSPVNKIIHLRESD
jgi:WD40 repeat protein